MIVATPDDGKHHDARLVCQILLVCFSTLLSSNVVSAAAGWDWSESLSGMGSKCNFLIV